MVESLHNVATRVRDFMLNCDLIDEVFGSDDELIAVRVRVMKKFKQWI